MMSIWRHLYIKKKRKENRNCKQSNRKGRKKNRIDYKKLLIFKMLKKTKIPVNKMSSLNPTKMKCKVKRVKLIRTK